MTREQKWDLLWSAACGVMAAHERYSRTETARPAKGLFRELDRLDEQCVRLRRVIDEISPDEISPSAGDSQ